MLKNNIFEVVKFNFLLGKYFGFFPFSVNFKTFFSTEIVCVEPFDYVIHITSVLLSATVTYYYKIFSIGEANSVILEIGVFVLFKICLASTIVIKITNFLQRRKLLCIITNLHWIDEKVNLKL